jgi:VIT1/CCC1 family predicted Fe2+/Mn2+ transporter
MSDDPTLEPPPLLAEDQDRAAERSLVADLRALADDGRTLIEAELAYQKSRAAVAAVGARGAAGWGALALACAFFTLMAVVIGALLTLAPLIGPLGATGVVTAALLVVALVAALAARGRWRRAAAALVEPE